MSSINVTDAGGQTFSVEGCATIGDLKLQILEHTGVPVDRQQLARRDTPGVEMVDATRLDGKDELALIVKDTNGGCEVAPFYLKIQGRSQGHRDQARGERAGRTAAAAPRRDQRRAPRAADAATRTAEDEGKGSEWRRRGWALQLAIPIRRAHAGRVGLSLLLFFPPALRAVPPSVGRLRVQVPVSAPGDIETAAGARSHKYVHDDQRAGPWPALIMSRATESLCSRPLTGSAHAPAPIEICLFAPFPRRCLVCYSGMDWEWNKCNIVVSMEGASFSKVREATLPCMSCNSIVACALGRSSQRRIMKVVRTWLK